MTVANRIPRRAALFLLAGGVAACGAPPDSRPVPEAPSFDEGYGPVEDGQYLLPGIDRKYTAGVNKRQLVSYSEPDPANSIVVDRHAKFLYYILGDGTAWRYPIGVGREGLAFNGVGVIQMKREWPSWTPTQNMIRREPHVYAKYAGGVPGGLRSPLGARALYIYRNGKDSYFRIHGTNDLPSIGFNSSAGCIRLFNQDILHLYDLVSVPTRMRVRTLAESVRIEGEEMAHRGDQMAPTVVDIDTGETEVPRI